jgi:hypothetical protein
MKKIESTTMKLENLESWKVQCLLSQLNHNQKRHYDLKHEKNSTTIECYFKNEIGAYELDFEIITPTHLLVKALKDEATRIGLTFLIRETNNERTL